MSLLRELIIAFPVDYADLGLLLDKDPELDFFLNVAHLQLHRRQRALQRLTKVCSARIYMLDLPNFMCLICQKSYARSVKNHMLDRTTRL